MAPPPQIRFNIKSGSAKIILQSVDSRSPLLEVYQGNFFISSHLVKDKPTEINISLPENLETLTRLSEEYNLPFDSKLTRVILPYGKIKLIDIKGDITPPEEGQTPKVKYLAYGSSITHGLAAIRPTGTYAMKTAYILGVDLINLGEKINTSRSELSPFVKSDESILYYSSDKRYSSYGGVYYFNVCVSELDGDRWGKYKMIGSTVNSGFDEIVAGINPVGDDVFVFHNRYGDEVISYTRYKGRYRFELLSDFGPPIDMKGGEYGVCMTADRDTLFYAAEGEDGSTDLFYAMKLPDGKWGESRLLPGKINSEYDENFPVFMPDENRIYFSSNNEASMGGYDLFYSDYDTISREWSEPVNLGYPVSDTYDNYSISWVKGKRIGYISAIRPEGIGNRDIYKVVYINKDPSDVIYRCSLKVQADSGLVEPWFTPEINVYDTLQLRVGTYSLAMDSAGSAVGVPPPKQTAWKGCA